MEQYPPHHGHFQQSRILARLPRFSRQPVAHPPADPQGHQQQQPAVARDEIRGAHHQRRERRQRLAHVLEQGFKLGHNKPQHEHDGQHSDHQQNRRVDQRRYHIVAVGLGILQILDQTVQDRRELAAGLPGPHHINVEVAEYCLVR